MFEKDKPSLDPITAAKLREAMKDEAAKREAFKPAPRIRRPWLGTLNWERHKRKMERKRRAANKLARQTRKAQRGAANV